MKKNHLAAAAAFASLLTSVASAVPIRFDFTGTVTSATSDSVSLLGQSVSAYMSFETEGLVFSTSSSPVTSLNYVDKPTVPGPSLFSSGVSVGGNALPVQGLRNEGRVNFFDGCTPECPPQIGEAFSIWTSSQSLPYTELPNGRYYDVAFTFLALAPYDPMWGTFSNYFDVTPDLDVTSVLTLPIFDTAAFYDATIWDCVEGACSSSRSFLAFDFDTITRSSTPVPEPGTFALFGVALAGMFVMRRRRGSAVLAG